MNDPRRSEVESLAATTFRARQERIVREFGDERSRVINRVALTNNSAGYLPALAGWAVQRLRETITAQADTYIEAFIAFNMPCDDAAEKALWSTATGTASASIMNVRNDHSVKQHNRSALGSPWHLEIEREMHTAVKEGIARMKTQRATVLNARKQAPVSHTINLHGPNPRVNIDSVDNSVNVVHQGASFPDLRRAVDTGVADAMERATIQERLAELEQATDQKSGWERYAAFMAVTADHMTVILPFLPFLHDHIGKLLGG
jgi:hypothetical protein